MDKSKLIEVMRRHLGPLRDMVGPQDWAITWLAEPANIPDSCASCSPNLPYNTATIRIDPAHHENEDDVIDSMFHELCHLLLTPFDVYREAATQHIDNGTVAERQDNYLFNHAREQAVLSLERVWNWGGLRDSYLERFTSPDGK